MIKDFEDVTELTIDNVKYPLSELSQPVQDLVSLFNSFGHDEVAAKREFLNAQREVIKSQRALMSVHNDIIATIRKEQEDVDASESSDKVTEDSTVTEPVPSETN